MSKAIQVGDLVVVVRGNGCAVCEQKSLGRIFVVRRFETYLSFVCTCNRRVSGSGRLAFGDNCGGYAQNRLRRIPPLTELRTADEHEETEA